MSRQTDDLLVLYNGLGSASQSTDVYVGRPLNLRPNLRIAKDSEGNPTLLISSKSTIGPGIPPLEFRYLFFQPRCLCRVNCEGMPEAIETFAVLKCTTNDGLLREYFLRCLTGLVAALSTTLTEDEVAALVTNLVELFRAIEDAPRNSLQGIWCELFLIARATRIRQAAMAWHADAHELYDFVAGKQRLEVKSTTGPHRVHEFRLEQLLPLRDTHVVIASFILEERGTGISINDLWSEILANPEMTVELRERLSRIVSLSLGRDWRKMRYVAFDPEVASRGLRLYDADLVPRVDPNVPAEVTDIRFHSELTDAPSLSREEAIRFGGLFQAIFG
jgi:Putative  PD-(D/E)XK family member, (DUF4420)